MPATAYPVQMDGYDPAQQAAGMPASQGINPQAAPSMTAPPSAGNQQEQTRQALEQMRATMPSNEWQQFVADMQAKSPEERAMAITQMATNFSLAGQDAQTDMSRADALREGSPTGRNAGGVYVSSNPLQHVAQVMNNKKRQEEYAASKDLRTAARDDQTAAVEGAMSRALRTQ